MLYILSDMKGLLFFSFGAIVLGFLLYKFPKKVFIFYLIPCIGVHVVIAGALAVDYEYYFVKHTSLTSVSIDELQVGMVITDKSLERYGAFQSSEGAYYYQLKTFSDITVDRDENNRVRYLSANSNKVATNKQIRVGDDFKKAKQEYGPDSYSRMEQSMAVLGYRDRELGITLEFYSMVWEGKDIISSINITDYRFY